MKKTDARTLAAKNAAACEYQIKLIKYELERFERIDKGRGLPTVSDYIKMYRRSLELWTQRKAECEAEAAPPSKAPEQISLL